MKKINFHLGKLCREQSLKDRLVDDKQQLISLFNLKEWMFDKEPIIKKGLFGGIQALLPGSDGIALIITNHKCENYKSSSKYLPYSELKKISAGTYDLTSLVFGFKVIFEWKDTRIVLQIPSNPPGWSLPGERKFPQDRIKLCKSIVNEIPPENLNSKIDYTFGDNVTYCIDYISSFDNLNQNPNEFARRLCLLFLLHVASNESTNLFDDFLHRFDHEYKQSLCNLEKSLNGGAENAHDYYDLLKSIDVYHHIARSRQVLWATLRELGGKMTTPSWPIDRISDSFSECSRIFNSEINVQRHSASPRERAWHHSNQFGKIIRQICTMIPIRLK